MNIAGKLDRVLYYQYYQVIMNSQFFIQTWSALYLMSTCGACTNGVSKETNKGPGYHFILTDDQRWDVVGWVCSKYNYSNS